MDKYIVINEGLALFKIARRNILSNGDMIYNTILDCNNGVDPYEICKTLNNGDVE